MAKHLNENDIEAILNIIDGWKGEKFTWEKICVEAADVVGKKPTRQSLNSHKSIKQAYDSRKKGIKAVGIRKPLSANQQMASDRIKNLESKISRLTMHNDNLLEKFTVWQYNAYKNGLTPDQLNEPLSGIDRERSDE